MFLFVLILTYSVYAYVNGLTIADIKAGHFFEKPSIESNPQETEERKCVYGEWLPCNDNGKHIRHEVLVESQETEPAAEDIFVCGQPSEEKACEILNSDLVCTQIQSPVCVCTEYDITNVCTLKKRFDNPCLPNFYQTFPGKTLPLEECNSN